MAGQKRLIVVGIVGGSRERDTGKLLESILVLSGYRICHSPQDNLLLFFKEGNDFVLLVNLRMNQIASVLDLGIEFDIIVHTFLEPVDYKNTNLKHILRNAKYILINSDEEKWTVLMEGIDKSIVITYGFNNKATVNLSSYNIHDIIEANICLQRKINAINHNIVEPFELPIKINSRRKADVYTVMAAMLCGLVIGIDIFAIKSHMLFNKKSREEIIIQK